MKPNAYVLVSVFVCWLSACTDKLTPEMVIEKSLEKAHGGMVAWETPTRLVYEKTTTLYDSLQHVEIVKKQTFHNTLQPIFTSTIRWVENGVEKHIVFDGKATSVFSDNSQITDAVAIEAAYKEVMAAQYVLWQPYKLVADEASLTNEGIFQLEDGSFAHKIKVVYPNSDTHWWYYFDTTTFLLKENLIQHSDGTYSQIINISQEEKTGLRLHKERKSFKINATKDRKYLRAAYQYNILELK